MDSKSLLIAIIGLFLGYLLGKWQTWYFARKLEHHGVTLKNWSAFVDLDFVDEEESK